MFNEDNTTEQMIISTLQKNGFEYIPPEKLERDESDVMVESMVREALVRLNPEIAEDESRADEIIYKLRTLLLSTNPQNLVTQNPVCCYEPVGVSEERRRQASGYCTPCKRLPVCNR